MHNRNMNAKTIFKLLIYYIKPFIDPTGMENNNLIQPGWKPCQI